MLYHDTPHYPNIHTSFYQDNPTTVQPYINNPPIIFSVIHYSKGIHNIQDTYNTSYNNRLKGIYNINHIQYIQHMNEFEDRKASEGNKATKAINRQMPIIIYNRPTL